MQSIACADDPPLALFPMALKTCPHTLIVRFDQKVFDAIYSGALVYNTCREDPAVDRLALNLDHDGV